MLLRDEIAVRWVGRRPDGPATIAPRCRITHLAAGRAGPNPAAGASPGGEQPREARKARRRTRGPKPQSYRQDRQVSVVPPPTDKDGRIDEKYWHGTEERQSGRCEPPKASAQRTIAKDGGRLQRRSGEPHEELEAECNHDGGQDRPEASGRGKAPEC